MNGTKRRETVYDNENGKEKMCRENSFVIATAPLQAEVKILQNSSELYSEGSTHPNAPEPCHAASGAPTLYSSIQKSKASTAHKIMTNNSSIIAQ